MEIGSKEWKIKKRNELLRDYPTFNKLQKYERELMQTTWSKLDGKVIDHYNYYTLIVIVEMNHWDYMQEFKNKYPKSPVSSYPPIKPKWLDNETIIVEQKQQTTKHNKHEQLSLF